MSFEIPGGFNADRFGAHARSLRRARPAKRSSARPTPVFVAL
jgi:hypothetical protein